MLQRGAVVALLLVAGWMVSACSGISRLGEASHDDLLAQYQAAVDDAESNEAADIDYRLQAVVPWNPNVQWQGEPGASPVRMVTWTDWHGYDGKAGETMTLGRDVWVTLVPELRNTCRRWARRGRSGGRHDKGLARRLEQLVGLPPDDGRDRFVEMWVDLEDLFRPCPDPEISDRQCELDFPVSAYSELSPHYATWFNNLVETMYGEGGYPWTRLGYTYDWGRSPRGNVGLSELIVRQGADVEISAVYEDLKYCRDGR